VEPVWNEREDTLDAEKNILDTVEFILYHHIIIRLNRSDKKHILIKTHI